jgi:hypothetical protein
MTIFGSGFSSSTAVNINTALCSHVTVYSSTELTCEAPALPVGEYPLNVTDGGSSSFGGLINISTEAFSELSILPSVFFGEITGIAADNSSHLFLLDKTYSLIYEENLALGEISLVAGSSGNFGSNDGIGLNATFENLNGIVFNSSNGLFYIADGNLIRTLDPLTYQVSTVFGQRGVFSITNGTGNAASFGSVNGVTLDSLNQNIYLTDTNIVRIINLATQEVGTLAGLINVFSSSDSTDGSGDTASFYSTKGIIYWNQNLYVTDITGLRVVNAQTGNTTTLVQSSSGGFLDGSASVAQFSNPQGIALDSVTQKLYISDTGNSAIRKVDLITGNVSTVFGNPNLPFNVSGSIGSAEIEAPFGILFLSSGSLSGLYVGAENFVGIVH